MRAQLAACSTHVGEKEITDLTIQWNVPPTTLHSMATWSKEETLKLIEIWGDDRIQSQLEGVHRNQDVFNKIAREMGESGFDRTFQQCRDKLKKLKSEYRKLKDKQGKTGAGRIKDWDYFDPMDATTPLESMAMPLGPLSFPSPSP